MSEAGAAALGAGALAVRLLWYLGGLGAAGLALLGLASWLPAAERAWLGRWRRRAAMVGMVAALAGPVLQYVRLAAGGPLADPELWGMVLAAPSGLASGLGVAGCLAILLGGGQWPGAAGVAAIAASHAVAGHALALGPGGQALVALHVVLAAAWVASLPLLLRAVRRAGGAGLLTCWGRRAVLGMPLLLASGLGLAAWLGGAAAPPRSGYGLALLAKLALVAGMLGLAARHRFRLVPALAAGDPGAGAQLARSIRWQAALALMVLGLVAAITAGHFGAPPAGMAIPAPSEMR